MSRCLTLVCAIALVSGCTAVSVQPVADSQELRLVCIIENPKVVVRDFVGVVERRFGEHGIGTKVVSDGSDCEHTLEYTAERSWDLKAFLDYALLTLRKDGVSIGSAEYRNKGGLTVTKYASTASKMNPVIDELLGAELPGN